MIALLMAGAIWVACDPVPDVKGYVFVWSAVDGSRIGVSSVEPKCRYEIDALDCRRVHEVRVRAVGRNGAEGEFSEPVRGFPTVQGPSGRQYCVARPRGCHEVSGRFRRVLRLCWIRRG